MSKVPDRRKRRAVLAVLGTVLLLSVVGATLVVGADRTIMNAEFVTDGLDDEGVYEVMAADMVADVRDDDSTEVPASMSGEGDGPPVDRMIEDVVSPSYVESEVERNVHNVYGYLDGSRDELVLAFDVEPVKAGLAEEMEVWVLNADVETIDPRMAALAENESAFESRQAAFEEEQLERIQRMSDEHHSRAELEAIYEDNEDQFRDRMTSDLESDVADEGGPEPVQRAAVDYGTVGIDALLNDEMTYDEFVEHEAAAREPLAAAVGDATRQRLDEEMADRMDLTADMDESAMQGLETVRTGSSLASVLLIVLPLVALASAGLVGYVSRRRSSALWRVGGTVAVAGVAGLASSIVLSRALPTVLNADPDDPSEVAAAMLAIGRDLTGTIAAQSLVVLGLGLGLVGAGVAIQRELLPVADQPLPDEPGVDEPGADEPDADEPDADEPAAEIDD